MAATTERDGEPITAINITPMVDVVLVLLIIFMATAPLIARRALSVTLPKASKAERTATQTVRVELTTDRRILLDGNSLSATDLERELKRKVEFEPATHVAIAADEKLPYGQVVSLIDTVKAAGIKRIGLEVK